MNDDSRKEAYRALARRATNLAKFANVCAESEHRLDVVAAALVDQVLRTSVALFGGALLSAFFGSVTNALRDDHGLCICGAGKSAEKALCDACDASMEALDRETEQLLAMDKPTKGRH